ncbi:MAG: thiamine diphosphokinase, partial [Anaerovoracaceae bacterium]
FYTMKFSRFSAFISALFRAKRRTPNFACFMIILNAPTLVNNYFALFVAFFNIIQYYCNMNRKCAVITTYFEGDFEKTFNSSEYSCIICADGGYNQATKSNVSVDYIIGDFDSINENLYYFQEIVENNTNNFCKTEDKFVKTPKLIKLNREKDETDTAEAILKAIELGFSDVDIIGGVGGRLDHTIANIQNIYRFSHKISIKMYDEKTSVYMINSQLNKKAILKQPFISKRDQQNSSSENKDKATNAKNREEKYISLFAFAGDCLIKKTDGLKYPLKDYALKESFPLGVSNEAISDTVEIEIESGTLLVILSK